MKLFHYIRQKSNLTSPLDRLRKLALMCGAGSGCAAGQNLSALGEEAAKLHSILVVYMLVSIDAKLTYLFALMIFIHFISAVSVVSTISIIICQGFFLLSLVLLCFWS